MTVACIEVLDPTVGEPGPSAPGPLAQRRPVRGAVLALVVNGKPNAGAALNAVEGALREHLELKGSFSHHKSSAALPLETEEAQGVARRASVAILGVGDCGACTACTVNDAVQLERLGIPTLTVITEPFQGLATEFALRLGMPAIPIATLPHPVASRTSADLQTLASRVAPVVLQALTQPSND